MLQTEVQGPFHKKVQSLRRLASKQLTRLKLIALSKNHQLYQNRLFLVAGRLLEQFLISVPNLYRILSFTLESHIFLSSSGQRT